MRATLLERGADLIPTLRRGLPEVVVLDVLLPDVSGQELLRALRAEWPDLPVLVCSGYATPDQVRVLTPGEPTRYLGKPFTRDQLWAALGELVATEVVG